MRKFFTTLAAVLFVLISGARAFQASGTFTGKLIDLACYTHDHGDTGLSHNQETGPDWRGFDCARACAKEGFDVALLTADGKTYKIRGGLTAHDNDKLWHHMAETVTIIGQVSQEKGQAVLTADDLTK